ncbi:MAG TPA: CRTAC1 family protein, partial [Gemmatimonadaceae bacterium]|nr:CRTAC1 family protein [Gemmatimonadaceae bacterium]
RNDGGFLFTPVTRGPMVTDTAGATKGHAWGDLDADGHLDLYAANGTPRPAMHNWLYRGLGAGEYVRVAAGAATADADTSSGTALADADGDGKLDIFVANWGGGHDEDNVFYRNESPDTGRWIAFDLRAPSPNRYAIGAVVRVRTQERGTTRWQSRWLITSTGYGSQSDSRLHFGLGSAERVEEVEVRWPNGPSERHGALAGGTAWHLAPGAAPRRAR